MRNLLDTRVVLFLAFFATTVYPRSTQADVPSPRDLLAGLKETRSSLKSGHMRIRLSELERERPRLASDIGLSVQFDGDRVAIHQVMELFTIMAPRAGAKRAMTEEFIREGLNPSIGIQKGLGKQVSYEYNAFLEDGSVFFYCPQIGAQVIDRSDRSVLVSIFMCDPRTFGINSNFARIVSLAPLLRSSLDGSGQRQLSIAGDKPQDLNGKKVWQVVSEGKGVTETFWIDETNRYRVHRYDITNGKNFHVVVDSTYSTDTDVLPRAVDFRRVPPDSAPSHWQLAVDVCDLKSPIDQASFTLAGLGMPYGQRLMDERGGKSKVLGYWDGQKLLPNYPKSQRVAASRNALTIMVCINILVIGAIVIWRLRRKVVAKQDG